MTEGRRTVVKGLLRGVAAAIALTLAGMAMLAALVVYAHFSDEALRLGNQIVKAVAVTGGAFLAVGPGGRRGLLTGGALGLLYMLLGYALAGLLGGRAGLALAGEFAMSALIGAAAGALTAQLPPRKAGRARRAVV